VLLYFNINPADFGKVDLVAFGSMSLPLGLVV